MCPNNILSSLNIGFHSESKTYLDFPVVHEYKGMYSVYVLDKSVSFPKLSGEDFMAK